MENYRKLSICIIDDDEMTLKIIKKEIEREFKSFRAKVFTFLSGEEFEKAAIYPHIAIVDHYLNSRNLSAMNGMDVIERLKVRHPATDVIMFTSHDSVEMALQALKLGAQDYIVKQQNMLYRLRMSLIQCIRMWVLKKDVYRQKRLKRFTALGTLAFLVLAAFLFYFSFRP